MLAVASKFWGATVWKAHSFCTIIFTIFESFQISYCSHKLRGQFETYLNIIEAQKIFGLT